MQFLTQDWCCWCCLGSIRVYTDNTVYTVSEVLQGATIASRPKEGIKRAGLLDPGPYSFSYSQGLTAVNLLDLKLPPIQGISTHR